MPEGKEKEYSSIRDTYKRISIGEMLFPYKNKDKNNNVQLKYGFEVYVLRVCVPSFIKIYSQ